MNKLVSFMARPRNFFWAVFAIKVLAVLVFVMFFGTERLFWSDSALYRGLGEGIFRGEGFASTRFMPLYPTLLGLFLWAFGEIGGAVLLSITQAAFASGTALILFLLARRFVPEPWALGAALLFSLEPFLATLHILLIPETVFVFFLSLFVYAFVQYLEQDNIQSLLFSSLVIALALYTKPAPVYLVILIALLLLFVYRKPRHALLFFVITAVLMGPWMIRNKITGGSYDLTSDDAGNICSWGLVAVLSTKHRLDSSDWNQVWALPEYSGSAARCRGVVSAVRIFLFEEPKAFLIAMKVSTLSLLTNEGYSALLEKPADKQAKLHHNYLTPVVFINYDWPTKVLGAVSEFSWWELAIIGTGKLLRTAIAALATVGVFLALRDQQKRRVAVFFIAFIVYFVGVTVLSTGFGVGARLRYPIELPMLVFAVLGLSMLLHRRRECV